MGRSIGERERLGSAAGSSGREGTLCSCPARRTCSTAPEGSEGEGTRGTRTCLFLVWGNLRGSLSRPCCGGTCEEVYWDHAVMEPSAHGRQPFRGFYLPPPCSKTYFSAVWGKVNLRLCECLLVFSRFLTVPYLRQHSRVFVSGSLKDPCISLYHFVIPHLGPFFLVKLG